MCPKMIAFRSSFPDGNYKFIKGTLQIHEAVTAPGDSIHILFRNTSCAYNNCLNGIVSCERINQFKEVPQMTKMNKHIFNKSKKSGAATTEYVDLNENEVNQFENADFSKNGASKLIKDGDIAVIKTEDYLLFAEVTEGSLCS